MRAHGSRDRRTLLPATLRVEALEARALMAVVAGIPDLPLESDRTVVDELTNGAGGSTANDSQLLRQVFVTEVNDAPAIANLGGNITYTEGSAPVRLAGNLLVTDPDSANFAGGQATIQISSGAEPTDRLVILPSRFLTVTKTHLLFTGSVVATYSGGEGGSPLVINLNNLAVLNRVQHILRQVAFVALADEPSLMVRSVDLQVTDGEGGSSPQVGKQVQIVPVDDAPVLSSPGNAVTYVEHAPPVRIASSGVVADPDSPNFGALQIRFLSGYQGGDELSVLPEDGLSITGSNLLLQNAPVGSFSGGLSGVPLVVRFTAGATPAVVQTVLRNVAFRHTTSAPSSKSRTLAMFVNADGRNSATLNREVHVVPVNNAPVLGGLGGIQSYQRNGPPIFIASNVTVADPDTRNFNNGKLTVRFTSGANEGNRLLVGGGFGIYASNRIWWQGAHVGTRNAGGGIGVTELEITFNANATAAIVQQLMRALRFQTIKATNPAVQTLEFKLMDGSGGTSNLLTKQIAIS
jgi:hypothetical protein